MTTTIARPAPALIIATLRLAAQIIMDKGYHWAGYEGDWDRGRSLAGALVTASESVARADAERAAAEHPGDIGWAADEIEEETSVRLAGYLLMTRQLGDSLPTSGSLADMPGLFDDSTRQTSTDQVFRMIHQAAAQIEAYHGHPYTA